jgi:hypothetical protein
MESGSESRAERAMSVRRKNGTGLCSCLTPRRDKASGGAAHVGRRPPTAAGSAALSAVSTVTVW